MGEYAEFRNNRIKIGTCEMMYYLRYEDRLKVKPLNNNLDPNTEMNLFWRLPVKCEDNISPGHYSAGWPKVPLVKNLLHGDHYFSDPICANHPGVMQLRHNDSGLLINVKCYHGVKLPIGNDDFNAFWNGKGYAFELVAIKNETKSFMLVIECRFCGIFFTCDFGEIEDFISDKTLRDRLSRYF